jgi:hypothetical protein
LVGSRVETTWVPGVFQLWVRGSQRAPPHRGHAAGHAEARGHLACGERGGEHTRVRSPGQSDVRIKHPHDTRAPLSRFSLSLASLSPRCVRSLSRGDLLWRGGGLCVGCVCCDATDAPPPPPPSNNFVAHETKWTMKVYLLLFLPTLSARDAASLRGMLRWGYCEGMRGRTHQPWLRERWGRERDGGGGRAKRLVCGRSAFGDRGKKKLVQTRSQSSFVIFFAQPIIWLYSQPNSWLQMPYRADQAAYSDHYFFLKRSCCCFRERGHTLAHRQARGARHHNNHKTNRHTRTN